jgi:hypothetical protein
VGRRGGRGWRWGLLRRAGLRRRPLTAHPIGLRARWQDQTLRALTPRCRLPPAPRFIAAGRDVYFSAPTLKAALENFTSHAYMSLNGPGSIYQGYM